MKLRNFLVRPYLILLHRHQLRMWQAVAIERFVRACHQAADSGHELPKFPRRLLKSRKGRLAYVFAAWQFYIQSYPDRLIAVIFMLIATSLLKAFNVTYTGVSPWH